MGHHFDGARFELTVHYFSGPRDALASATVAEGEKRLTGNAVARGEIPRVYVAYLRFAPWQDFVRLRLFPATGQIEV